MQSSEKLSITLPLEMARAVRERVASGAYGSNSEVIREALRGWLEQERRVRLLDASIERGLADATAGRVRSIEDVRAELVSPARKRKTHRPR